jgi:hypothetical protein
MPRGELHAKELEVFVKHGGYTPMEAIVAATRDNAYAVGLEGQVGQIARPASSTPTTTCYSSNRRRSENGRPLRWRGTPIND